MKRFHRSQIVELHHGVGIEAGNLEVFIVLIIYDGHGIGVLSILEFECFERMILVLKPVRDSVE